MRRNVKNLLDSEISLLPSHEKKWSVRAAVIFPNSYSVGMSNIGFITLFSQMHNFFQLFPQRFFVDFDASIEKKMPLSAFPIIASSIAYEMDFLNLVKILRLNEIPVNSEARKNTILIAGGAAATINPYPIARIADVIFLGQGKIFIEKILRILAENPPGLSPKNELLDALVEIPGVWVPALDEKIPMRAIPDDSVPPFSTIVSSFAALPNMALVQIQRGCPFRCPFCATPIIYNPFFNYPVNAIIAQLENWRGKIFRAGLVGSAIADHPELGEIIDYLNSQKIEIYTSSLRLDRLKPKIISALKLSRQKSLTFAPETGSEKLKKIIGKKVEFDDIIRVSQQLKPLEIKLYYILGIPGETDDDAVAIADDVKKISAALPKTRIVISANAFIPKKGTIWENREMESHKVLLNRFKLISKRFIGFANIRFDVNYKRRNRLQWPLSCGERDVTDAMATAKSASELANILRKIGWNI